jgi:hypothetical protein
LNSGYGRLGNRQKRSGQQSQSEPHRHVHGISPSLIFIAGLITPEAVVTSVARIEDRIAQYLGDSKKNCQRSIDRDESVFYLLLTLVTPEIMAHTII